MKRLFNFFLLKRTDIEKPLLIDTLEKSAGFCCWKYLLLSMLSIFLSSLITHSGYKPAVKQI